jgi:hypothetical protein
MRSRNAKIPLPETRDECDELYRPRSEKTGNRLAYGSRLLRAHQLGAFGIRLTNQQAHELILNALYDPDTGLLRPEHAIVTMSDTADSTPP